MKRKAILSFLLALVMAVTSVMPAMAEEVPVAESEDGYLENHYQIDLTNLDIEVDDGELEVEVQDNLSKREEREATGDAEMLEFLVDRYEDDLVDFIEENVEDAEENGRILGAICMTECPLEPNEDGDFDRIEADDTETDDSSLIREASAANSAEGKSDKSYYFSLVTVVSRGTSATKNKAGEYLYFATSKGVWYYRQNDTVEKRPATGNDFIIQATPGVITETNLSVIYNSGNSGQSNGSYCYAGGSQWKAYTFKDAKVGNPMKRCSLQTDFRAKPSKNTRVVNSYYVHTWKEMSVSFSLSASSSKEVSLSVTPTIVDKSWQVHSWAYFNF